VWILSGVAAGSSYHLFFLGVLGLPPLLGGLLAGLCGVAVPAWLLVGMKFSRVEALVISVGGLCIALPNWSSIHLGFPLWQGALLTVGGLLVSLPPFMRGMKAFHLRNPRSKL